MTLSMIADTSAIAITKQYLSDFLSTYKKGHLNDSHLLKLMIAVTDAIENFDLFSELFEEYKDNGYIEDSSELLTGGNISFYYKNKEIVMSFLQLLVSEADDSSVDVYLYNTMDNNCSLEGIHRVLNTVEMPSDQEIIDDNDECFYMISEWLSYKAITRLMDKVFEYQLIMTTERFMQFWGEGSCYFSGMEMQRINASGVNLVGADFSFSSVIDCTFKDVVIKNANFDNTFLINSDFTGADLRGSDFTKANIDRVNFTGADLRGAIFAVGGLEGAVLTDANMEGVKY